MRLSPAQIRAYENEIARIQNVDYCHIVLDMRGEIRNVDIVSDDRRSPQRIVRDAEVIFRKNGVDLDHRKIGVVQMAARGASPGARSAPETLETPESEAEAAPAGAPGRPQNGETPPANLGAARRAPVQALEPPPTVAPSSDTGLPGSGAPGGALGALPAVLQLVPDRERVRLAAVHCTVATGTFLAEVELAVGSIEGVPGKAAGSARDPAGSAELVVRATVEAVRNLLESGYEILVRDVRLVDMAGVPVVAVMLDFGRGRDLQRLCGTCPQRGSLYETAVYATLDALNRRLGQSRFRELVFLEPGAGEI
jgi:hypothetical protein